MANTDPETNRLYSRAEDLHPLHWHRLAERAHEEAARAAGARWDGRCFRLPVLGRELLVGPEARSVTWAADPARAVGYQRALAAVAYLGGALDAPPKGEWVAFRDLPGGDAFFRGPHSLATPRLAAAFGAAPGALGRAASALGGRAAQGADAAADLPALPRIPLRVLLWAGTAEFSPSAALLVDRRAHLHLALDVLWALSNVAISDLVEASR